MVEFDISNVKIKKDEFRRSRGNRSVLLIISCAMCRQPILLYQKDGSGILKRMYFDRIHLPESASGWEKKYSLNQTSQIPQLKCCKCQQVLAVAKIYDKEKRLAFVVVDGSIKKTRAK